MSRQKTKKWANFKPQNYDGDDWGADYDEQPDEPEPLPPPNPMGPRLPAAPSRTGRQFQPPGAPPLHTETQQPSAAGEPDQKAGERVVSPQSNVPESAVTASSVYSSAPGYARPVLSPVSRHDSPAPHSAGTLPSQFPSRQGSMGPYDPVQSTDPAWRSRPNPPLDERSASPAPQSTASLASTNKPLPFIRPADVYRRMEEERNKGRLPQGGIRTPSGGPTPVADRKSEYGIDGLLDSYGHHEPDAGLASTSVQDRTKTTEPGESTELGSPEKVRRYSTSPKLPDLARVSSFGEDLFSTSFFPDSKVQSPVLGSAQSQALSRIPESVNAPDMASQSPTTPTPQNVASTSTPDTENTPGQKAPQAGIIALQSQNQGAVRPPSPPNEPDRSVGLPLPEPQGAEAPTVLGASRQQQPAPDAKNQDTLRRPSLPGGWVSETPTSPGDPRVDSIEPEATTSVTQTDSEPEVFPPIADKPQQEQAEKGGNEGDASLARPEAQASSRSASPHAMSPVRTSSPVLSTKLDMPSGEATPKIQDQSGSPTAETAGPVPAIAAIQHSEIPPTAPLNPRRESPVPGISVQTIALPPSFETGPTLDAPSTSPVKDSDALSEEIIKSLSPPLPAGNLENLAEGSTLAYRAAAEPVRESSYLGDVYGEYWAAATDDRAGPAPLETGRANNDAEKEAEVSASLPADAPKEIPVASSASSTPTPGEAQATETDAASATGAEEHLNRFSWEACLERSDPASAPSPTTEPILEQKSLGSAASNLASSEAKGAEPDSKPSSADPHKKTDAATPVADKGAAGGIPHEGPQASTVPQSSPSHGLAESASPVPTALDKLGDIKPSSLAEDKILLEELSSPPSLPPPLELHPALAGTRQKQHDVAPRAPSPPEKEAFKVPSFRNIMEMGTPSERIKHYNETRLQYFAMESGLEDWLRGMLSRHPEHANPGFQHAGAAYGHQGSQRAATTATTQGGRPPANIPMPPQPYSSGGFAHSSNQMGTKSKELLMAAGKAGKGLLSKGRNKLRGTGDKVFSG